MALVLNSQVRVKLIPQIIKDIRTLHQYLVLSTLLHSIRAKNDYEHTGNKEIFFFKDVLE